MLFSIIATLVLQEMAARLGLVTQKGLADVIKTEFPHKWLRNFLLILILGAILIGNTAYEGGNIAGAVLGMEALLGKSLTSLYPILIGGIAFLLLWKGSYKFLEKAFIILIGSMSLAFVVAAIVTKPSLTGILKGLFVPSIPKNGVWTIIALIGTTVVPYNLFLHTSLVNEKWKSVENLKDAQWDTLLSIALGGIVSLAIIIAATAIPLDELKGAADLAEGLTPVFGVAAKYVMGVGLFAAGITSSITAPLAAAFVAKSCFGWSASMKDPKFRLVWMAVLLLGVLSLQLGLRPIEVINFAQVANGLLLPLIAVLLVVLMNRKKLMGTYRNASWQNLLGILIIGVCILLGIKSIGNVFGWW